MQYVNFVFEDGDEPTLHNAPVGPSDAAYLRRAAAHLEPLSDEQYLNGPLGILRTAANHSYVLDGDALYWCIEWQPGLIVVKISREGGLQWAAFRSPVPNFGGREPLPEDGDPDEYDCDNNPQYNLIFIPRDAQYDEDEREAQSFVPADSDVQTRFKNALARVNALENAFTSRNPDSEDWLERCKQNLATWAGVGVRLDPAS